MASGVTDCYLLQFVCVDMQAFNEAVYQCGYTLLCLVTFECNVFKLCSNDCWFLGTCYVFIVQTGYTSQALMSS